MNRKDIAEFISDNRKARGITQTTLANKVKISQGKISKVEAGKLDLSVPEFSRILKVFGWEIKIGDIENE